MHTKKLADELELISTIHNDPVAFAIIYENYFPKIYNYVRCRINQPDAQDDLISTIFEKALSRIDSYCSNLGTFSTWLFTIAHNVVVDYFKEQQRLGQQVSLEILNDTKSAATDLQEKIIADLSNEHLMQTLQQLSEREQNIISLKFWGELSNRDIAKLTGLSESNVGIILYRSMQRLRSILYSE